MYRASDVLDVLLPHILDRIWQPLANLVANRVRDENAARLGQRLQPGGDIDAVPEDILRFDDHIAEVDANSKIDALVLWDIIVAVSHCALDFRGAADRIQHTRKFGQHAVAGVFYDAPAMLLDLRIDQLTEMRLQALVSPLFIHSH